MTPIDIQVSRSKVSVEGQAFFFICWGRGALVFYKQLYFEYQILLSSKIEDRLKVIGQAWLLPGNAKYIRCMS